MSITPLLSMIVAKSRNGVIGLDGDLPWHLSSDLQFFKRTTLGKPVLMGRVTWESLPFALPGRPNLVLSRDKSYRAKGAEVFGSLHNMIGRGYELAGATGADEIMIIGGAGLYGQCLEYADRLYVSDVDILMEGDAHFPAIQATDWVMLSEQAVDKGPKDDYPFTIRVYERRNCTDRS